MIFHRHPILFVGNDLFNGRHGNLLSTESYQMKNLEEINRSLYWLLSYYFSDLRGILLES